MSTVVLTDRLLGDAIETQHVPQETHGVIHYDRFAFDGGNRFSKWFSPVNLTRCLPSCIKEIDSWQDAVPDENTVVIDVDGVRYLVGQQAKDLKGIDVFTADKAELARILLFAAIEPTDTADNILIDTLAISTPDSRLTGAVSHLQRLSGTHSFLRNGRMLTARINRVEIVDECLSAWRYAWNHGGFAYACKNGVLDLGGGTALARIILPSGMIVRDADIKLPGTADLARRVAAALKAKSEFQPDLGLIMDGIANQTFRAGQHGVPFAAIFEKARQSWLEEIRGQIKTQWASHLSEIGEVLVVGGSAELARPFVEASGGRFKIPVNPSPQLINLYGLQEG